MLHMQLVILVKQSKTCVIFSLSSDHAREYQLLRSTASPLHPFSKFGSGNLKTLHELPLAKGIDLHAELLQFHRKQYSAHKMRLAVVGAESLDTLEQWIRSYFGAVANAGVDSAMLPPGSDVQPLGPEWMRLYQIIPHQQLFKIGLYFPMPSTNKDYLQKPYRLLSHCLGHEGDGSVLSALKRRGWAAELAAGPGSNQYSEFAIFQVSIQVTEDGVANWQKIIAMVFEYIRLIRESDMATRNRIRDEVAAVEEVNFKFKTRIEEERFVEQIACNQLRYPAEFALCGPDLLFEPLDESGLAKVEHYLTKCLVPTNVRVHLICPKDKQPRQDVEWQLEQWYQTEFAVSELSQSQLERWCQNDRQFMDLFLPLPNPYVPAPSSLLISESNTAMSGGNCPSLIIDTPLLRCWHLDQLDATMRQPKVAIQIQLTNGIADTSLRYAVLLRLMLEALQIEMNEERYNASEAGLDLEMVNTHHLSPVMGLRFVSCGYDPVMPLLLKRLFKCLSVLELSEDKFRTVHETTVTDYRNRLFAQPFMHAMQTVMKLVESPCYTNEDRLGALHGITVTDLNGFCREFLSASMKIESVVVGNMGKNEAQTLMHELLAYLNPTELAIHPKGTMVRLDPQYQYKAEASLFHPHDENGIVWYIQFGPQSTRTSMKAELLTQFLDRAMYAQLRTAEQLGYVVGTSPWQRWGISGMFLIVQSSQPVDTVDERIRSFLCEFGTVYTQTGLSGCN
jgi:insulysin